MFKQNVYNDDHTRYGIDEIYLHDGLELNQLQKLHQRAELTLDGTDNVISKNVECDMILIFYKKLPSASSIYRFLEYLKANPAKNLDFKKLHLLINADELFEAIKVKKFVLLTKHRISIG